MSEPTTVQRIFAVFDTRKDQQLNTSDVLFPDELVAALDQDGIEGLTPDELEAALAHAPKKLRRKIDKAAKKAAKAKAEYQGAPEADLYAPATAAMTYARHGELASGIAASFARHSLNNRLAYRSELFQDAKAKRETLAGKLAQLAEQLPKP
jgi:thiol:disulfide interchange protein